MDSLECVVPVCMLNLSSFGWAKHTAAQQAHFVIELASTSSAYLPICGAKSTVFAFAGHSASREQCDLHAHESQQQGNRHSFQSHVSILSLTLTFSYPLQACRLVTFDCICDVLCKMCKTACPVLNITSNWTASALAGISLISARSAQSHHARSPAPKVMPISSYSSISAVLTCRQIPAQTNTMVFASFDLAPATWLFGLAGKLQPRQTQ